MFHARNNVLDIAKFWAIISVLIYHLALNFIHCEVITAFINTYFLSLFFFISGLLIKDSKLVDGWNRKQVSRLLIPFISCWVLYRLFLSCFGVSFITKDALGDTKSGFWYIFVLFVFNVFLKGLKDFISRCYEIKTKLAILIIPFVLIVLLCILLPYDVAGYFSMMSMRRYWLFFAYGYAIANLWKSKNIIENNKVGYASLLAYTILAYYYVGCIKNVESSIDFVIWFVTNLSGIHAWLFLFNKLKHLLSREFVINVGYNTFGIYVFHYFPLYIWRLLLEGRTLENTGMCLALYVVCGTLFLLVISYFITILIKKVNPLARILLGIK